MDKRSWSKRVNPFEGARKHANRIGVLGGMIAGEVEDEQIADLIGEEFAQLLGNTQSDAGLFGMLPRLTKERITDSEAQWFRNVAKFCRRAGNAMLGKPLDDPTLPLENMAAINQLAVQGKTPRVDWLGELQLAINAIEAVFPPEQKRGARR